MNKLFKINKAQSNQSIFLKLRFTSRLYIITYITLYKYTVQFATNLDYSSKLFNTKLQEWMECTGSEKFFLKNLPTDLPVQLQPYFTDLHRTKDTLKLVDNFFQRQHNIWWNRFFQEKEDEGKVITLDIIKKIVL